MRDIEDELRRYGQALEASLPAIDVAELVAGPTARTTARPLAGSTTGSVEVTIDEVDEADFGGSISVIGRRIDVSVMPRSNSSRLVSMAAAVILVLFVGAFVITRNTDKQLDVAQAPGTTNPTTGPGGPASSHWQALPPSPLAARQDAKAFTVESKVLLLGGNQSYCPPSADCQPPGPKFSDGAVYDASTTSWHEIASTPVPLDSPNGVVVGHQVFLLTNFASPAFVRYDLDRDEWKTLTMPPTALSIPFQIVATDDALVAYLLNDEYLSGKTYRYDVQGDTWSALPDDPLGPAVDRSYVWTGREIISINVARPPTPGVLCGATPCLYRAAALDLATSTWRRLPDSEIVANSPVWVYAGGRVLNPTRGGSDGGQVNNWGRFYPYGGVLDPATGTWSALPNLASPPLAPHPSTPAANADWVESNGVVYQASTGRSEAINSADGVQSQATAWVNGMLFVWGGVTAATGAAVFSNTGWLWSPTATETAVPTTFVPPVGPDTTVDLGPGTSLPDPTSLKGTSWVLDSITTDGSPTPFTSTDAPRTLRFDSPEAGMVTASDGCNGISGTYRTDGATLTFSAFQSILTNCSAHIDYGDSGEFVPLTWFIINGRLEIRQRAQVKVYRAGQ